MTTENLTPVPERHSDVDEATQEALGWRALAVEIKGDNEQVAGYKKAFEEGLERLIGPEEHQYHPRVSECITSVKMIPTMHGIRHDSDEKRPKGSMRSGALSRRFQDPTDQRKTGLPGESYGRYLTVETLDNASVVMHEMSHVAVRIGDPYKRHIFREPLTNRYAHDIMTVKGMDTSDLDSTYRSHGRILSKVMQVSGLSMREISFHVSGENPIDNDKAVRQAVYEGMPEDTRWDVVGFAQNAYLQCMDRGMNEDQAADQVERWLDIALEPAFASLAALKELVS